MAGRAHRRGWGHIRKLPSRKWQASYSHRDERHTAPVTFTARTDAEAWLATERRLIERGEWTPPQQREAAPLTPTLAEYASVWIEQRSLKETTRQHYEVMLAEHIIPVLGAVQLERLTPQAVRSWHATTLVTRPTYRAHTYSLLHAVCATAVKDGLLDSNPCQIQRAMTTHPRRQPVILEPAEVATVAELIDARLKALVLISAWCGLRWGEVVELRRKDVSEGAEILSVSRAVTHRGECRISTPKSGRGRMVIVPPHIRPDIENHLANFVDSSPDSLLFVPIRGGCHYNDGSFRNRLKPALKAIGREGMTVHDLRHFAGTMTARVGSVVEVVDRLGHSTMGASLRYQQIVGGRPAEIAEGLSELART